MNHRPPSAGTPCGDEPPGAALRHLGYEVIPFKTTRDAVLEHVPRDVPLTVTASPAEGQDATIDLAVQLAADGYSVAPHLSARQVRDRAHLAAIVARCPEAGLTSVFVVGGDRTSTPTKFHDARDLLTALHDLGHGFTDIGIGGHPEGHPEIHGEALFAALADKAPLATHIKTQIVFDPGVIAAWARELVRRGTDLPVYVGVPRGRHTAEAAAGLGRHRRRGVGEVPQETAVHAVALFVPGGYNPDKIIKGLAPHLGEPDNRIAGFHVFTFNDLGPTEAWRQQLLRRASRQAASPARARARAGKSEPGHA